MPATQETLRQVGEVPVGDLPGGENSDDDFSEEMTLENEEDFNTDEGSIPDLEDDPVQAQSHVLRVRTTLS